MYHINDWKFDTRKNNLKIYSGKIKLYSAVLTKTSPESLEKFLAKRGM